MRAAAVLLLLAAAGCGPVLLHDLRRADGSSISRGPDALRGWADPPLPAGLALTAARPGQRLVLWSDGGFEAIVDVGDPCEVMVPDGDGARAAGAGDLARLARLLEGWPLAPAKHPERYAGERAPGRRFRSHVERSVESSPDPVALALSGEPAGWMDRGGRIATLMRAAERGPAAALERLARHAPGEKAVADASALAAALLRRSELSAEALAALVAGFAGRTDEGEFVEALAGAAGHAAADLRVLQEVVKAAAGPRLLSSQRRRMAEAAAGSPAADEGLLMRLAELTFDYADDRAAVAAKAASHSAATDRVKDAWK